MKRLYRVDFQRQANCYIDSFVFYTFAQNAPEAKKIAQNAWTDRGNKNHMFHLEAHRADVQDPDEISFTSWCKEEIRGRAAMDLFFCIHSYAWRVNGVNVFGH